MTATDRGRRRPEIGIVAAYLRELRRESRTLPGGAGSPRRTQPRRPDKTNITVARHPSPPPGSQLSP